MHFPLAEWPDRRAVEAVDSTYPRRDAGLKNGAKKSRPGQPSAWTLTTTALKSPGCSATATSLSPKRKLLRFNHVDLPCIHVQQVLDHVVET